MRGIGGSGGGGGTDTEDEDEEDDGVPPEQTTVDDIPDDETTNDSSGGAAAAAGAVSGAAAGTGGGAAPGGGGAAAGGGAAKGAGGSPSSTDGSEDSEDSEGSEPDSDADSENEEETEEGAPEDTEDEQGREAEETNNADQAQNQEAEELEPEEEDEQGPQEAELTVVTDAWDATGWGIEPVLKRLEQEFGISFDLSYGLLSPREPEGDDWNETSARYDMPYAQLVELPDDTRISTSALHVAQELDRDGFRDYLRRLRIAALVKGRNIEDRELLIKLAGEVGFDTEEFDEAWRGNIYEIDQYAKTPLIWATVGDYEIPWRGNLEYGLAFGVLLDNNVPPLGGSSSYERLVSEYEPITTTEVATIMGDSGGQVEAELEKSESARKVEHGDAVFWKES